MSLSTVEVAYPKTPPEEPAAGGIEGRTPLQLVVARLRTDRVALASIVVIALIVVLAIAAPLLSLITGHSATQTNVDNGTDANGQPLPPGTAGFLLGTDNLGRDILVRIAYGARISLLVGVLATAIATVVGVVVGLFAGYFGGWLDSVLARIMDVVLSFPYVLFAIVLVSVFGSSLPLTILVIAFFSFAAIGRIVRGQALSQREKEYVEAAHSLGAGNLRIMFIDILPNLVAPVIVLATLLIPAAIIFEATLSFLGLGVQPPTPSWGNMLSDAEGVGFQAWWFYIFPMLFLLATTLAFNLLGDAVRDALDPRTERLFAGRRHKKPA
ncbi:MAG: peptide/nickel transport system permease protein [Chloroflexota bacterium]|jgi:peptide/nickel transport system permease protein|nr:peptide/nickel transport system permease protein [Chloroflexota bacterium]